jgi:Na+/glutamate symporter
VFNNLSGGNHGLASKCRLKLSTVALAVFLAIALIAFVLRNIGAIGDVEYVVGLVSLVIAALIVTVILGRVAKKRYTITAS